MIMRKRAYFASERSEGWPSPGQLEHYFLAPPGQRWFFETENDGARFVAEGVDGTGHLQPNKGRIDIDLKLWGNDDLGVLLIYSKFGGGHNEMYSSRGDLTRLRDLVRSLHEELLPVGLFIPFPQAWKAVKEFIETDGGLPRSIEWIANDDLPPNTFPRP
jgi:hypothetical protein